VNGSKEPSLTDAACCTNVGYHIRASKTFNNQLGFERGFWQRQFGRFAPMPKRSVCGTSCKWFMEGNVVNSVGGGAIKKSIFSNRRLLDLLHLRDTYFTPAIIFLTVAIIGGFFVWLANWSTDYTRLGYSRAQVASSMMIQSDNRPPGMRIFIVLQDGKTLQTSTRNRRLFAMTGEIICVELRDSVQGAKNRMLF
jgi:hypothetical protein